MNVGIAHARRLDTSENVLFKGHARPRRGAGHLVRASPSNTLRALNAQNVKEGHTPTCESPSRTQKAYVRKSEANVCVRASNCLSLSLSRSHCLVPARARGDCRWR